MTIHTHVKLVQPHIGVLHNHVHTKHILAHSNTESKYINEEPVFIYQNIYTNTHIYNMYYIQCIHIPT